LREITCHRDDRQTPIRGSNAPLQEVGSAEWRVARVDTGQHHDAAAERSPGRDTVYVI